MYKNDKMASKSQISYRSLFTTSSSYSHWESISDEPYFIVGFFALCSIYVVLITFISFVCAKILLSNYL